MARHDDFDEGPSAPSGLPGFVMSVLGLFTCGLFTIVGLYFTIKSFSEKGNKAWSWIGLIIGLPQALVVVAVLGLFFMGMISFSSFQAQQIAESNRMAESKTTSRSRENTSNNPGTDFGGAAGNPQKKSNQEEELRHKLKLQDDLLKQIQKEEAAAQAKQKEELQEQFEAAQRSNPIPDTDPRHEPTEEEIAKAKQEEAKRAPRTWTDRSGSFKVEASYRGLAGSKVILKRTDNDKEIRIDIEKLSEADLSWLEEFAKWKRLK